MAKFILALDIEVELMAIADRVAEDDPEETYRMPRNAIVACPRLAQQETAAQLA